MTVEILLYLDKFEFVILALSILICYAQFIEIYASVSS